MYSVANKRRKQRVLIRALARAEYDQTNIARILGVAQSTVSYWVGRSEQAARTLRMRKKQRILIRALARTGHSQINISRILDLAKSTVEYWLGSRERILKIRNARNRRKACIRRYRQRPEYRQQRIEYDVRYNLKRAAAEYGCGRSSTNTNV